MPRLLWHASQQTMRIGGADPRVLDELDSAGLSYTINSGKGALAPNLSEAGVFGAGVGLVIINRDGQDASAISNARDAGVILSKHCPCLTFLKNPNRFITLITSLLLR